MDFCTAVLCLKVVDTVLQDQPGVVHADVFVEKLRHFVVKRRHDLILHLYDRHVKTCPVQIFRHLKADKASADHGRPARMMLFHVMLYIVRIRNIPEGENTLPVNAGDRRF